MRFGQGERSARTDRVLRGDDEKGIGQRPCGALNRHLPFFHGFEQGALAFWGGPVDLVRQNQLGEDGPWMESELAAVLIEHRGAENIARQKVRGELDPLEFQPHHPGERMAEGGLTHAGQVLDQQVPSRQQAGHGQSHL